MNILDLVKNEKTIRKVGNQNGGEYHAPCPTCGGGEDDPQGCSDRMQLFPLQGEYGTWFCRGCVKGGDAIEYLIFHERLSFPAACEALGKELPEQQEYATPQTHRQQQSQFQPRETIAPADAWQNKAGELVEYAYAELRANDEQLAFLQARGISAATAHRQKLGWLPGENGKPTHYRSRKSWGIDPNPQGKRPDSLWIPRGILVPQIIDDVVQRIRIRRPEADRELFLPDRSYHVLPGSGQAPLLIYRGQRVITVLESELDGVLIEQEAGDLTGILSMGNSSIKPDAAAHTALCQADLILVALDFDEVKKGRRAGGQAWIWWSRNYKHAIRWPVAIGKDPGDAYKEGLNIRDWIQAALPAVWTEGIDGACDHGGGKGPDHGEEIIDPTMLRGEPPLSAVAGIAELGNMLQAHKYVCVDMTGDGCKIDAHPNWRKNFDREFSRISKLVFHDKAVFNFLVNHPAEIITGQNYWEGSGNE